ncbi:MAG: SdrD B-like domain-containing protein, partial [Peptostreptococcaceae bacterium]
MVTISGSVIFDKDRSATINLGDTGLAGVSVVLQDTVSGKRLTVLTDVNGNYSFINVPDGNYIVVESYGLPGVATPADFSTAVAGPVPVGIDPPIAIATSPPAGSTNLDSTSPNTLSVTVSGSNPPSQNFLDGPIIYTPITSVLDTCVSTSTTNLITSADNGTFGTFLPGTPTDTGAPGTAANPPYPGVTPGFVYTLPQAGSKNPNDGQYTIQNTSTNGNFNNANVWWRMSDHTVGDETGRFMFVNGSNAGQSFFMETLPVTANTNYLFSSWITNMIKVPNLTDPLVGIKLLDQNGNTLYNGNLTNTITANTVVPEWKQVGTVFNSGNNTQLTVEFLSQGGAASGNDYAIDDIKLQPISIPTFVPVKSANKSYANIGDVITYTTTISNTCTSTLTNVSFLDTIPQGVTFIGGSVNVNGTTIPANNPQTGFALPNIAGNSSATVTFSVTVVSIPNPNPTNNIATVNYSYSPVTGGLTSPFTVPSNIVPVTINNATLSTTKTVDNAYAKVGDTLTYTITITNTGNVPATNVVMTDPLAAGTSFVANSVTSTSPFTGNNPATGITLTNLVAPSATVTITYKVTVIYIPVPNPIPNSATFNYKYIVDPSVPAGVVGTNTTPIASTQVNTATLTNIKSVDKVYSNVGDTLTYTLTFKNTGNINANNVLIKDPLPAGTTLVPGSLISSIPYTGTDLSSGLTLTNPILPNQTLTIVYKVLVGNTIPNPNPIPNTATSAYTFTVNPAVPNGASSNGTTNTVATTINHADLLSPGNFVKSVDNTLAKVGDTLTYTLVIKNTGNAPATNVLVTDPIPNGTTFVSGSITSTIAFTGTIPATGITLTGPIPAGGSVTITYKVTVTSVPTPNPIPNTASVNYSYIIDPINNIGAVANGSSNTVNTKVNYADLTSGSNFTKTVDKTVDGIGDILT